MQNIGYQHQSKGSFSARSQVTNSQSFNVGQMAKPCPWNRGHTEGLFYSPRNNEISFENKLIENQYIWRAKELEK